jgi:hypothetical protein
MNRTDRITEVERKLSLQEDVVAQEIATFRALEAELESLRSGVATNTKIDTAARTEAILNVLHTSGRSLSPAEIVQLLHDAGRDDDRVFVTATLSYLVTQKRIQKPGRARYLAL